MISNQYISFKNTLKDKKFFYQFFLKSETKLLILNNRRRISQEETFCFSPG
ncbi:hypothetical protein CTL2C_572 [Chlamydia trachomatis L2c]|nr:hypothetical protein CTL2C_572 [Chlamydia trachomatis L2c]